MAMYYQDQVLNLNQHHPALDSTKGVQTRRAKAPKGVSIAGREPRSCRSWQRRPDTPAARVRRARVSKPARQEWSDRKTKYLHLIHKTKIRMICTS
jgi:hypothetical protein